MPPSCRAYELWAAQGIALCWIAAFTAFAFAPALAQEVKLGFLADLTGPIAEMGLDIQQGAEVALAELNEAGGIQGFPVEFVVED